MNKNIFISFFLDKRREKLNGKFPLKIRAFQTHPRKQKLFPTKYDFSEEEFNDIFYPLKDERTKKGIAKLREELAIVLKTSNDVADNIVPFNFEKFEQKLYVKRSQEEDVFYQYDLYISKLIKENRVKTASNYDCSKMAFINFQKFKNTKTPHLLDFRTVTPQFLNEFEKYFLEKKGKISSVGSYTRPLRAIFNIAISEKIITTDFYPFRKGGYVIPSSLKVKKALSEEELKILYNAKPITKEQEIAKDFWFLSYMCNGMNIKDICLLRNENLSKDTIQFIRAKTKKSKRTNVSPIFIHLNEESKKIIEKHSIKSKVGRDYIFGKINDSMSEIEKVKKIDAFNKFVSQHVKLLATSVGIDNEISSIWARHSFATILIQHGSSIEQAQQCLGHTSKKTTEAYFSGFSPKTMQDISIKIMNFNKQ
jgi:integrase/recombinase XerD